MALSNNPMFSPENLLMLSGNILAGPNFGAGVGTGLQQLGSNLAAQKKAQEERQKQMQEQTQAANFLRQKNPGVDLSNYTPGMINAAASTTLEKQLNPAKPEFKVLDDGSYGTWNGEKFTVLGKATKPEKLPAIAEEYNWAKQNGFNGTPQEYQTWKANLSKQKGMTVSYDPVNGFQMTQGDVDKAPPKLTDSQSKDINFLGRAKKAEEQLAPIENELTSWAQKRADGLPFDAGNYLKSREYQVAEQAGKEILAIILRKDTGAAVTEQEFKTYGEIYLPQPGDGPEKIAAKRASREAAIRGIQAGLGPLAPEDADEVPGAKTAPIPAEEYFKEP